MALVGDSRVAEILANVALPFLAAQGTEVWPAFEKLPARLSNRRLETAVTRLFGGNARGRPLHPHRGEPTGPAADLRRLLFAG